MRTSADAATESRENREQVFRSARGRPHFHIMFFLLLMAAPAHAADPRFEWRSFDMAHFVITYPRGYESWAGRVGVLAEKAHDLLTLQLGWIPSGRTHIVVTD